MRGYESRKISKRRNDISQLFLPMRGYESEREASRDTISMLFLPMRGYEKISDQVHFPSLSVISPHEGL